MKAPQYAPDIAVLGVAALAPATDLVALIKRAGSSAFGKIVSSYVLRAFASVYPDVSIDAYVTPMNELLVEDISSRCVGGWETIVSVAQTLLAPGSGIFSVDPTSGALGSRLRENVPTSPIAAPVLIAQGAADDLVFLDVQRSYVAARCREGQAIDFRVYADRDHISLVAPGSPLEADLFVWTADRFAGRPSSGNCR